jgi:hypothetical protein
MTNDDPILRLAFKLWHESRLKEFEQSNKSNILGFWPSVYTDFIKLPEELKKLFIDKAQIEYRDNSIEKIIKKDE